MSWRLERVTFSRGKMLKLVIAGAFTVAVFSLAWAMILSAVFAEPPVLLFLTFLAAFALAIILRLGERASFYIRRTARRRRLQR